MFSSIDNINKMLLIWYLKAHIILRYQLNNTYVRTKNILNNDNLEDR